MHDFKFIETVKDNLIVNMLDTFPNAQHTIIIVLWNDGTFRVRCQWGDTSNGIENIPLHIYQWYNDEYSYILDIVNQK